MATPPLPKVPVFNVIPIQKKSAVSVPSDLRKFIAAHPQLKQYALSIQQWSDKFGVNPLWTAAVLVTEHGYDNTGKPTGYNSSGHGFGLAQINPTVWFGKTFQPTGETINEQWAAQPGNAIQFAAWYLSTGVGTYGTLDGVYQNVYNPGSTVSPSSLLKGFPAANTPVGTTPYQGAVVSNARKQAQGALPLTQQQLREKYFNTLMQRAVGAGYSQSDAKTLVDQALQQTARAKLPAGQETQFLTSQYVLDAQTLETQLKQQGKLQTQIVDQFKRTTTDYAPTFLAYAGRAPTAAEIQSIINQGTSKYQVAANLMKSSGFQKSPIWLQNAARYQAYYTSVFGPNTKAPDAAISYAIQHSLDETAFKGMLQKDQMPGQDPYNKSEEYRGLYATYQSAYSNIYGLPDNLGKNMIDQAIRKGWTADQWTQYLRKQPEYTSSGEYQARALDIASRMGLVQGGQSISGQPSVQQTMVSPKVMTPEATELAMATGG